MEKQLCSCPETLAIATVPKQEWCEPYSWETALYEGTIFPCLNHLFYKAPLSAEAGKPCPKPINDQERAREELMKELYAISFAINDLTLYLDTHPDCPNATPIYHKLLKKRLDLLAEFSQKFYPLTQISIVTGANSTDDCSKDLCSTEYSGKYTWSEGPMPWEGGCI